MLQCAILVLFEPIQRVEYDTSVLVSYHLSDLHGLSRLISQSGEVDNDVHGGGDLLTDRFKRQTRGTLKHHRFQTAEHILGGVGMAGRERTVMTGVHRLQHVQRLAAATLTDDDSLGPHSQRGLDQIANRDLAGAGGVRVTGLEADKVVDMLDLQLGGVLDGDDTLIMRDVVGQRVEEGRLTGAGTAADKDIVFRLNEQLELVGNVLGDRAVPQIGFAWLTSRPAIPTIRWMISSSLL